MGYRKYRYYNNDSRKKYYSKGNSDLGDALAEIIIELIFAILKLLAKLIYKFLQFLWEAFHQRGKTRETYHLNITQAPVTAPVVFPKTVPVASIHIEEIKALKIHESPEVAESRYSLKKSLVTDTEQGFLKILEQIVGNRYRIVPQVLLSGIVSPKDSNSHFTNYHDFNKIKAKSIDFVLYDKESWTPRLAIELDDRSHLKWKRIQRDQFIDDLFEGVGLKILHMPVAYSHNLEYVRAQISEKIEI